MKYNHLFWLGFSIETEHDEENILKVPVEELKEALYKRIDDLIESGELHEAIGPPDDTYEVEE